jgi:hypothetical protein
MGVGESLYAPTNLLTPALITTDRPYAGLVVRHVRHQRVDVAKISSTSAMTSVRTSQTFDVNVGIVDPHAYGGWLQNTDHRLLNVRLPPGGPIKIAQGRGN